MVEDDDMIRRGDVLAILDDEAWLDDTVRRVRALPAGTPCPMKDAYRAGLEAAAAFIDCGCPNAAAVVALGKPNCAERWNLCGQANCAALDAAAIRAMKDDTP
jgi:hypothetical protein